MRIARALSVVLGLALVAGVLASPARADTWNKETVVTFSQPMEIPGRILPAGTYVFKLQDSWSWRHIVQVFNADKTEILATILAIPNYRLKPTGETVIEYKEQPGNQPVALRAWFYPGDLFGQEFVYPEGRAMELAQASKEIVPAETVVPTEGTLKTVPLVAVTPEKKEEPITDAIEVLPPHAEKHVEVAPQKLPQTGSSIPLVGLLGFAAIAIGIGLKLVAKQFS